MKDAQLYNNQMIKNIIMPNIDGVRYRGETRSHEEHQILGYITVIFLLLLSYGMLYYQYANLDVLHHHKH